MTQVFSVSINKPFVYSQKGGSDNPAFITLYAGETQIDFTAFFDLFAGNLLLYHNVNVDYTILGATSLTDATITGFFLNFWIYGGIQLPCFSLSNTFYEPLGNFFTNGFINRTMLATDIGGTITIQYPQEVPGGTDPTYIEGYIATIGGIENASSGTLQSYKPETWIDPIQDTELLAPIITKIRERDYTSILTDLILPNPELFVQHAEYLLLINRSVRTKTLIPPNVR